MTTPTSPSTARQRLIDWANGQDHWIRAVVADVLATRKELSEKEIVIVYATFLAEKQLSDDPSPSVALLSAGVAGVDALEDLRLNVLRNVSGVNALASGQEIKLNSRLTVLFGKNATGKTGYVRIFKRLAAVRAPEPVLGDFRAAGVPRKPHATIDHTLSGTAASIEWNDEAGVPPFTRMSVFDTRAVSLHVDEDLTYVFTPSDLALFRYVHQAIEAVRTRLEQERGNAQLRNTFLPRFRRDASVYPKIETLGPSTNLTELEALANVTADDEEGIPALRDKVESLRPQATESRLRVATGDRDLYQLLLSAAQTVRSFDWNGYNAAVERARVASERFEAAGEKSFAEEDLPGAFRPAWRAFIQSGEQYLNDLGTTEYPGSDDKCIYCRQDLGEAALALVKKYREYSNNAPKKELDASKEALRLRSEGIAAIAVQSLRVDVARRADGLADPTAVPPVLSAASELLQLVAALQTQIASGLVVNLASLLPIAQEVEEGASGTIGKAEELIALLKKQAAEREQALSTESAQLRLLENRLMLRTLFSEIKTAVERAKWASRAGTIAGRLTAILRALTEQSKTASEELLNQDFDRLFQEECAQLRAPRVSLDFAGRKGQAARRKTLAPDHRLSEILSEGEQKVIALADFLAEVSLRRASSPIIFDDPVNSLDYERLQYVVDRIVSISETRQVIVFTHNIWFATALLAHFEKNTDECTYYTVSDDENGHAGVVTPGTHPRWDSVTSIRGKINQIVQTAAAASGEGQTALVESAYGRIRSWCEVVVEQEFLAGVSQRYQANVAVTQLEKIDTDRLAVARKAILPLYAKACRIMTAHSQPLETLNVRPTLAELKTDWKGACDARDAYVKK